MFDESDENDAGSGWKEHLSDLTADTSDAGFPKVYTCMTSDVM